MTFLNKCGYRWVCQSWGDGEKSHSYWLLCLLSPSLLSGDQAMLINPGSDLKGLHLMTQTSKRRTKMLSSRSVLKSCSGRIFNWKHKWRLAEIQGVWKGRERRAVVMRECYWEGSGRKSKTSYAAQNYLASHLWPDYHRLSAQPHRGWLRDQLIKKLFHLFFLL